MKRSQVEPKSTINRKDLSIIKMSISNNIPIRVIFYGKVFNWVGIGWVDEGPATVKDYDIYPVVVD